MKKSYVKSLEEYKDPFEFDAEAIIEAMGRMKKGSKKQPTSIALEAATIKSLKKVAAKMNLPYQILMRLFILQGLKRFKV
jgi:predicted DNA binding CopG/RHH family protein